MSVKLNSLLPLRTYQKYFSTVQIKYYKCTRNLFVKTITENYLLPMFKC